MALPPISKREEQQHLYSIHGLTKVYGEGPTAVHALRGIDVHLPQSAMVVLLGARFRKIHIPEYCWRPG